MRLHTLIAIAVLFTACASGPKPGTNSITPPAAPHVVDCGELGTPRTEDQCPPPWRPHPHNPTACCLIVPPAPPIPYNSTPAEREEPLSLIDSVPQEVIIVVDVSRTMADVYFELRGQLVNFRRYLLSDRARLNATVKVALGLGARIVRTETWYTPGQHNPQERVTDGKIMEIMYDHGPGPTDAPAESALLLSIGTELVNPGKRTKVVLLVGQKDSVFDSDHAKEVFKRHYPRVRLVMSGLVKYRTDCDLALAGNSYTCNVVNRADEFLRMTIER